MRFLAILAAVFLAGCAGVSPHGTTHRLEFDDGICSATAVGRHVLLSAAHCFKNAHPLKVDGVPVAVTQIVSDGADHVLVTVSRSFAHVAEYGRTPRGGEHVRYWGNPAGLHDMYREGYVSGVVIVHGKAVVMLSVNGFGGDSGAGVFDASGRLVGVISIIYQSARGGYIKFMGIYPLQFTAAQWSGVR